jgi:4,5-DOPA dioxygenase extradiol
MNRRQFLLSSGVLLAASVGDVMAFGNGGEKPLPRTQKMPVLFIGHGSPMNAIERNEYHLAWRDLGERLPRPSAILVVSAHWQSLGVTKIMSNPEPQTIHDFGGFPDEMYQLQYPAPGMPYAAGLTDKLLQAESPSATPVTTALEAEQGFDHGTWCVLLAMYPKADIPVYQLSIDIQKPADFHYAVGQKLAGLRERGVMILGSGNLIHNLRAPSLPGDAPFDWAQALEQHLSQGLQSHDDQRLIEAPGKHSQIMRLAHPTLEHYYPLLYALGSKDYRDSVKLFNASYVRSAIAMHSVLFLT